MRVLPDVTSCVSLASCFVIFHSLPSLFKTMQMRINRSVIFAVGIAGALSVYKKGEKEPNVGRREKYKAQG